MFGGKSAAKTFFSRLFEKDKVKKEEPELIYQRKRSQSLFAPNVAALLSGEHVGGVHGMSSSVAVEPLKLTVPVTIEFDDIMTASERDMDTTTIKVGEKKDEEDEDLEYLRLNCDRLNDRRATNFTQVKLVTLNFT